MTKQQMIPEIDGFYGAYYPEITLTIAMSPCDFIMEGFYPGEVIYKDDAGAICRCFNWRESVRTMLTEDTRNAFMCVEMTDADRLDDLDAGLDHLAEMIERELGGSIRKYILNKDNREIELI